MATFVMQSLGCEVAALNTVHFSTLQPGLNNPSSDPWTHMQLQVTTRATANSRELVPPRRKFQISTRACARVTSQTSMSCYRATPRVQQLWNQWALSALTCKRKQRRSPDHFSGVSNTPHYSSQAQTLI